jgi:hypothetical protein
MTDADTREANRWIAGFAVLVLGVAVAAPFIGGFSYDNSEPDRQRTVLVVIDRYSGEEPYQWFLKTEKECLALVKDNTNARYRAECRMSK